MLRRFNISGHSCGIYSGAHNDALGSSSSLVDASSPVVTVGDVSPDDGRTTESKIRPTHVPDRESEARRMTYDQGLVIAARVLNVLAWLGLLIAASVIAGIGLEEGRRDFLWTALIIALVTTVRAIVWLLS